MRLNHSTSNGNLVKPGWYIIFTFFNRVYSDFMDTLSFSFHHELKNQLCLLDFITLKDTHNCSICFFFFLGLIFQLFEREGYLSFWFTLSHKSVQSIYIVFIKKCLFMLHLIILYQTRSVYRIFMNCYEGILTCLQCWHVCLKSKKEKKCLCMYGHGIHGSLWSPNGFFYLSWPEKSTCSVFKSLLWFSHPEKKNKIHEIVLSAYLNLNSVIITES